MAQGKLILTALLTGETELADNPELAARVEAELAKVLGQFGLSIRKVVAGPSLAIEVHFFDDLIDDSDGDNDGQAWGPPLVLEPD